MTNSPDEPISERPQSDQTEQFKRKLWFDYLSKINDRELHQNHLSGVSDWVLIGILGAILYRGIPLLPSALRTPGLTTSTAVMFTLLGNFVALMLFAVVSLLLAEAPGEPRLLPRSRRGFSFVSILASAGLAGSSLWLTGKPGLPLYIHYNTMVAGFSWSLVFVLTSVSFRIRRLHNKRFGAELPVYTSVKLGKSLLGITFLVSVWFFALSSGYALLSYILTLQTIGKDWVTPLSAAAQLLLSLGVLLTLYSRLASKSERSRYLALERDVVLEGLSSDEIGKRFTAELIGSSVSEWISLTRDRFQRCNEQVRELNQSMKDSIGAIEEISADFRHERAARANESLRSALEILQRVERSLIGVRMQLPGTTHLPEDLTQASKILPLVKEIGDRVNNFKHDISGGTLPLCEQLELYAGIKESRAKKLLLRICGGNVKTSSEERGSPPPEPR